MYKDFKEAIILLMHHPIMHTPIEEIPDMLQRQAYDLLMCINDHSTLEEYSLIDYIQMARIEFAMGELANALDFEDGRIVAHYQRAFNCLQKGGIDLSIKKWTDLVSIRTVE